MGDPLSVTASIAAILQLSRKIIQYLRDLKSTSRDRDTLLCEVASVTSFLSILKDQAQQADSSDTWRTTIASLDVPRGPLEQFKAALERLASKLAPSKGLEKIVNKLIWPFQKQEALEILNIIERQKSLFALAVVNDHIKLSRAIKHDVKQIGDEVRDVSGTIGQLQAGMQSFKDNFRDRKSRDIICWLSRSNYWSKQVDILNRKQEGTGNWVFEDDEFKRWLGGTPKVLLCLGIPGAGKTVVASTIIDHLERNVRQQDIGVAYIYCNYKERDQSPTSFIASLLQQFVEQRGIVSPEIRSSYQEHSSKGTRPTQAMYSKLLQAEIDCFSKVIVIVDALDECPESNGAREFLVRGLRGLVPKIQLLVTSRYIASIEHEFKSAGHLEIQAQGADIKTYLNARTETIPLLARLKKEDHILHNEILDSVIKKANGMFLLAQLHIEALAEEDNRRAIRRALQNLPEKVDQMYDEAMQRIESQDRKKAQRAEEVLSWMSYVERPLTIRELQHALGIGSGDEEIDEDAIPDKSLPISVCAGLVTVDLKCNVVRFVHYTTDEYFQRIRGTRYPLAQTKITESCLTYLSFEELTKNPVYPPYGLSDDSDNEQWQARLQKYPLLQYAACFWAKHAHDVAGDTVKRQIVQFLKSTSKVKYSSKMGQLCSASVGVAFHCLKGNITGLHLAVYFGLSGIIRSLASANQNHISAGDDFDRTPLHIAAGKGNALAVGILLDVGADPNQIDVTGWSALQWAVARGHTEVTQMLLPVIKRPCDPHICGGELESPLYIAAYHGHLELLRILIAANTDVNCVNRPKSKIEAWLCAIFESDSEIVSFLLAGGTNPKYLRYSRFPSVPLLDAARWATLQIVKILLKAGANPGPGQVLSVAAEGDRLDIVRRLLSAAEEVDAHTRQDYQHGLLRRVADVEILKTTLMELVTDETSKTPLQAAASRGHLDIVKELLLADADVNANVTNTSGFRGLAAVHGAAKGGHLLVVQTLIAAGAEADSADAKSGRTPLSYATESRSTGMTQALLARETVNPDSRDWQGRSPLSYAAAFGDTNIIQLIIDCGRVQVDSRDNNGKTPLLWAARHNAKSAVELLAAHGAGLEVIDNDGRTPFSHAAQNLRHYKGDRKVRKKGGQNLFQWFLARSDVQFDSRDKNGLTPLSWAAQAGAVDHVEALLRRHDVDINSFDKDGRTPLHHASGDTVRLFLARKDVLLNVKDDKGCTPLAKARDYKTLAVSLLLDARDEGIVEIEVDSTDNEGQRLLNHAMLMDDLKTIAM